MGNKMIHIATALLVLVASVHASDAFKFTAMKEGGGKSWRSRKSWKERFFVYDGRTHSINYYGDLLEFKAGKTPKGKIRLDDSEAFEYDPSRLTKKEKENHEGNISNEAGIIIHQHNGEERKYFISFDSTEERNLHLISINKTIKKIQEEEAKLNTFVPTTQHGFLMDEEGAAEYHRAEVGNVSGGICAASSPTRADTATEEDEKAQALELSFMKAQENAKVARSPPPEFRGSTHDLEVGTQVYARIDGKDQNAIVVQHAGVDEYKVTLPMDWTRKIYTVNRTDLKVRSRRLAENAHRAQGDEIGFLYAGTMIGGFSVVALFGAFLYRRFLRSIKPDDRRF